MGQILKVVLKEKNMTIKKLAEITGISKNTLYAITKRDSVHVRPETVEKIAAALELSPAYLLGWEMKRDSKMSDMDALAFDHTKKQDKSLKVDNAEHTLQETLSNAAESLTNALAINMDKTNLISDDDDWTEEELKEIEEFKKFILSKRNKR